MSKELSPLEWLDYYKQKIRQSNKTFRPNGFDIIEKELKALDVIKELFEIRIGIDESENDKSCGIVFLVADKDHIWEIYHTFDEENIQKLKLLKEVLKND